MFGEPKGVGQTHIMECRGITYSGHPTLLIGYITYIIIYIDVFFESMVLLDFTIESILMILVSNIGVDGDFDKLKFNTKRIFRKIENFAMLIIDFGI